MVPLNDENKLQVDEKHKKTEKIEKSFRILKMYKIICFDTIRYKLNASENINHSVLNCKLMKPPRILRLP